MAEYIEREAIQKRLNRIVEVNNLRTDLAWFTPYGVKALIEEIPAADVRLVVRGKWSVQEIYKHEMSYGTTAYEPVYKCSACGNLMESYLRYDEPIMPEDADFPRFWPNCGADMKEET